MTTTSHQSPPMPYYSNLSEEDKRAVETIYTRRREQGENDGPDELSGLEFAAHLYHNQKTAFSDVLTKEGFEICSQVPFAYAGRIAILTHFGTLMVLGKNNRAGRVMQMTRIHTPKMNYDGARGTVMQDLTLRLRPHIFVCNRGEVIYSTARALATNPRGADGNEESVAKSICESIHGSTWHGMRPKSEYDDLERSFDAEC